MCGEQEKFLGAGPTFTPLTPQEFVFHSKEGSFHSKDNSLASFSKKKKCTVTKAFALPPSIEERQNERGGIPITFTHTHALSLFQEGFSSPILLSLYIYSFFFLL